ncbi:MAG: acyclic terpene utilization AtuA family protein, partial [Phycisphaerales bacterium]|nr:acyclic terpene utilization AtuA family protein [Phycisphaerales bacterium]
ERFNAECLGAGDVAPGVVKVETNELREVVLRLSAADARREVVERFTREIAPLVTTGPQGTTGYAEGRPPVREVFGYWPTLIPRDQVRPRLEVFTI